MNNKDTTLPLIKKSMIRLNPDIERNQLTRLGKKAIGVTLANKGWKYTICTFRNFLNKSMNRYVCKLSRLSG